MIEVSDIKKLDTIPFSGYLKREGYSHSFLKYEVNGIVPPLEITDSIRLGKMVDEILTNPSAVSLRDPLYRTGADIAARIKRDFGDLLLRFQKQVPFQATFSHRGFSLKTKGLLDFSLNGAITIDLKVTQSKNVDSLINYMGYENQLWGYSKMSGSKDNYILIYSVPLKQTFLKRINCQSDSNSFWEEKILKFGNYAQ